MSIFRVVDDVALTDQAKARIEKARRAQLASIPTAYLIPETPVRNVLSIADSSTHILTARELAITTTSASELCRQIAAQEVSSYECTLAYIKRASIATQLLNCCTEIITDALDRAKELDALLSQGTLLGPLHGLPISFKEHILIAGRNCHCSYTAWLDGVEESSGLIYQVLTEAGAIAFARTTQPQSVMHLETSSNIYGHTVSPYDRTRTPGGSSGGESALLAFHGSPLGVGGDIGGSIRSPAALCGLYGFKPTTFRVPAGTKGLHKGRESIVSALGPMGHSLPDLKLFMKTVIDSKPWLREPSLIAMPWREVKINKSDLRVAVMWSDEVVKPLPPITRALKKVVRKLTDAGVDVVDWKPLDHAESWDIISSLYWMNGAEDEYKIWNEGGEGPVPLTEWILSQAGVRYNSYDENNDLLLRRNKYRTDYAQHWLAQEKSRKIDVILCPANPGPAPKLGTSKYWNYTSVWNLLDYPGVVFPVTKVLASDTSDYTPTGKEAEIWNSWDAKDAEGLPIALQLVARRFEDEEVLAALETIQSIIGAFHESS